MRQEAFESGYRGVGMNSLLLPKSLLIEQAIARVGLISDTHMPQRCLTLPASVFDVLQDVDVILHSGDVGELWVLDCLSTIAPVIAVHGNDDTKEAQRELPYQQLVSVAGQRILLWHSHYPDPAEEKASRGGEWAPKLIHQAERGKRVGAKIVVFGHAHIPLTYQHGDVLLINPGALASGSFFTRQEIQTVAILFISRDGTPFVIHVDLATPHRVFTPNIDWEAEFDIAMGQFQTAIVEEGLLEDISTLRQQTYSDPEAVVDAILPLCRLCWAGGKPYMTRGELVSQIEGNANIPAVDKEKVVAILSGRASWNRSSRRGCRHGLHRASSRTIGRSCCF
jgi:putative phosphoesterase